MRSKLWLVCLLAAALVRPGTAAAALTYDPTEVLVAPRGPGTVWYVDAAKGSDTNSGKSESAAFQTIGKAVNGSGAPLAPGDTVLIKAGVYREALSISRSGSPENRIVIGPFGDGEVVIDRSLAAVWTPVSGQIFATAMAAAPAAVVVDGQPLFPEYSASALAEGRWYFDAGSSRLAVWCPGGGSPAGRVVGIVSPDQRAHAVSVNDASHLTLYGLTVRFAGGRGISVLGNHVRVEKCTVAFNGNTGIAAFAYGATPSTGIDVVKNHIYHNFIRNWPRGLYKTGIWGMGATSHGTPNLRFIGNVSHKNGGEGLGGYAGAGGLIYKDNVVYDNWSVNIYVDNQPGTRVENNFVYCTEPDPKELYNNQDPDPTDNRNLRRLRADGIMTGDEDYGLTPPANLAHIVIANNVIVGCRRGIHHYALASGSGLKQVQVLNNTIVVPNAAGAGESYVGISIPYNAGNNVGSAYRNNIVHATHPSTYVLYGETDPAGTGDAFSGVALSNNLWFHAGRSAAWHWGRDYRSTWDHTFAGWLALAGSAHGAGDVNADPQLTSAFSFDPQDKRLKSPQSPAAGAGAPVDIAWDFNYAARPTAGRPDIGAFQYGSVQTQRPLPPTGLRIGH